LFKAVKAYDDVGEFYWKVWGEGWEHRLGELYGEIELPSEVQDAKDVYSWGHPEINGKIGLVENRTLIFQAFGIPSGQWMEIRVLFPVELLESGENAVGVAGPGLEKIIEEEKNWAMPVDFFEFIPVIFLGFFILVIVLIFIGKVLAPAKSALIGRVIGIGFFVIWAGVMGVGIAQLIRLDLLIIFILAEAALFALVWHFFGREPYVDLQAIYEREVPYRYSPAVVKALMSPLTKKPNVECITAELLDLCLKGKLQIKPIKKEKFLGIFGRDDFEIRILNRDMTGIPKSEKMVFKLISEAAGTKYEGFLLMKKVKDKTPDMVTLTGLQIYMAYNRAKSQLFARDWQKQVQKQAEAENFFSKKTAYLPFIVGTVVIAGLALTLAGVAVLFVGAEAIVLAVLFPSVLPNRTEKGALHHKKWTLLKKFLNDFSNLKEMPPDAIVIWEQYLVYSIPLGVAKKVQKAMDHAFKGMTGEYRGHIFAGSYAGFSAAGVGAVASSFSSAFSSASGTSGGGGFSGGGGGGGG